MSAAARRLRELVERLNEALMTLDFVAFKAGANIAEITLSEVDFVCNAIAAAADFIDELSEREVEGRTAGGSP